jgi:hypothetical protein
MLFRARRHRAMSELQRIECRTYCDPGYELSDRLKGKGVSLLIITRNSGEMAVFDSRYICDAHGWNVIAPRFSVHDLQ